MIWRSSPRVRRRRARPSYGISNALPRAKRRAAVLPCGLPRGQARDPPPRRSPRSPGAPPEVLPALGRYPRASLIDRVPVSKRGKIVLLHVVGQMPLAGIAWQAVNCLVGLEKLGYETWYVENHGANPYDPRISSVVMDCEYNLGYLRTAMERHGLAGRWAYWDAINDVYHGLSHERVRALYAEADGLINLCGATQLREEHLRCPVRIMIDTDPVYEQ